MQTKNLLAHLVPIGMLSCLRTILVRYNNICKYDNRRFFMGVLKSISKSNVYLKEKKNYKQLYVLLVMRFFQATCRAFPGPPVWNHCYIAIE